MIWLVDWWEEYVGDNDGGDDSDGICNEGAGDGVACLFDAHGTEIHGDNVKCRVGCTLEHATEAACKAIWAKVLHGVDHHAAGAATAKGLHEGSGEGGYNVVSDADKSEQ